MRSQLTEPQNRPSVTWTTISSIARGPRWDFVKLPSPLSQETFGRRSSAADEAGARIRVAATAAVATRMAFRSVVNMGESELKAGSGRVAAKSGSGRAA